jgi:hypothetical protein
MTSSSTPVVVRPPLRPEPLGRTTEERLARLPEIIDTLRRDDDAAERDRVLSWTSSWAGRRTRSGITSTAFLMMLPCVTVSHQNEVREVPDLLECLRPQ